MGHITADRVKDSTSTTGTGALTLSGTAPAGYQAFSDVMATGDTCVYAISSSSGTEWEVGIGRLTGTTTLARDRVLASSNANALVGLSAGTKDVFITVASDFVPVPSAPAAAALAAYQTLR